MEVDDLFFQSLVDEAWDSIPEKFKAQMENVSILVEDEPTLHQLRRAKVRGTLLGLYDGVPKTGWGQAVMGVQPSKITLFKNPIIRICRTPDDLKKKVREVLMHEIGHYFGYDESGIRGLEHRARRKSGRQKTNNS